MLRNFARSARALARQPGFALVAITTLALGIGANTAMFSILHAVVLRPLPVERADRLVMLWSRSTQRDQAVAEVGYNEHVAWRTQGTTVDDVAIYGSVLWNYRITGPGKPFDVAYSSVSGSFFDTLGTRPMLGRTLRTSDDRPEAPRVAVLSAGLWARRFGGDARAIGTSFVVGEGTGATSYEIVGVMPSDFDFPRGAELWTGTAPDLAAFARDKKEPPIGYFDGLRVYYGIARLKTGITAERAAADLERVSRAREALLKLKPTNEHVVVTPLAAYIFGSARPALYALMGAVGLLLLIACANVASLLLARGVAREREVAVRLALGASSGQILRWLLSEGAILAALGGAFGTALAALSLKTLIALSPADIPRLGDATIEGWALAFALVVSMAAALLVGIAPAWQLSRPSLVASLNQTARAGGAARVRTRHVFVAAEVALTVVLLVGAGLMAKSFLRLSRLNLGFEPVKVLTFNLAGPDSLFPTLDAYRTVVAALLERFNHTPGVVSAGAILQRPFEHGPIGMDALFVLEGETEATGAERHHPILNWESVTPGYFRTMGIRLLRGRLLDDRDIARSPLVIVVSQTMADRVWPGQNALGKRLRTYGAGPNTWQTVVGIVETARYREIESPRLDVYVPFAQAPLPVNDFVVRSAGDPEALVASLRRAAAAVHPQLTLEKVTTMSDIVRRTQGPWRFNMTVFGAFATVALLLATLGLFGLVAYSVSQRTREIGVRIALGASRAAVVRLMVGHAIRPVLAGMTLGFVAAFAMTRVLQALLFEVSATDPGTFAAVAVVLAAVAGIASYIPARRSASVDPLVALRVD